MLHCFSWCVGLFFLHSQPGQLCLGKWSWSAVPEEPSTTLKRGMERGGARRSYLKGRERAIVNQTNTGIISKTSLGKLPERPGGSAYRLFWVQRYHLEPNWTPEEKSKNCHHPQCRPRGLHTELQSDWTSCSPNSCSSDTQHLQLLPNLCSPTNSAVSKDQWGHMWRDSKRWSPLTAISIVLFNDGPWTRRNSKRW